MKRKLIISVLLFCIGVSSFAQTPWYLFPGARKKVEQKYPELSVPGAPVKTNFTAALILPLASKGTPSSNFLSFYSGVLIAASEYSANGDVAELKVFDSTLGLPTADELEDCDLIIGPVSAVELEIIAGSCGEKNLIVSPLDPKAAELTATYGIVQAPAGWEAQIDEISDWIEQDLKDGDITVVLQNPMETDNSMVTRLVDKLSSKNITFTVSSSSIGMDKPANATTRYVLLSENDSYIGSEVREIALASLQGENVAIYGTTRIRTSSDLDPETLYSTATRIVANYYTDNADSKVMEFSATYSKLFKADPDSFAFQGYDIMKYFTGLYSEFGNDWKDNIESRSYEGLQTSFFFSSSEDKAGMENSAVRRILYHSDNTTSLERR